MFCTSDCRLLDNIDMGTEGVVGAFGWGSFLVSTVDQMETCVYVWTHEAVLVCRVYSYVLEKFSLLEVLSDPLCAFLNLLRRALFEGHCLKGIV